MQSWSVLYLLLAERRALLDGDRGREGRREDGRDDFKPDQPQQLSLSKLSCSPLLFIMLPFITLQIVQGGQLPICQCQCLCQETILIWDN